MISISPTQNVGRLKPNIEPAMIARAPIDSGRYPAYMPSGMPIATAMTSADAANSSVAGMRCTISCSADMLNTNDLPRSPARALRTKTKYCSHSGKSSPSARMARSRSA